VLLILVVTASAGVKTKTTPMAGLLGMVVPLTAPIGLTGLRVAVDLIIAVDPIKAKVEVKALRDPRAHSRRASASPRITRIRYPMTHPGDARCVIVIHAEDFARSAYRLAIRIMSNNAHTCREKRS
jgi:hypothetical protein